MSKALQESQEAIRKIIGKNPKLANPKGLGRAFELYIMTGIGQALQAKGCLVWIQRSDGSRIKPNDSDREFIQTGGSPAGIGADNASSIVFSNNGNQWEILNGIQFEGRSAALHEIDIAIVPKEIVDILRENPSSKGILLGRPPVSIECKDVSAKGSLDEMRTFVARLYDLTILKSHYKHLLYRYYVGNRKWVVHQCVLSGMGCVAANTYRDENNRTLNVLARRTGFSSGTAKLVEYYGIKPYPNITVGSYAAKELMKEVADWICKHCR
ncbi:MAG: hypothetical protein ACR2PR_11970 [Pseudohongiellaceae bacterium]